MLAERSKFILVAIGSFLLGWLFFWTIERVKKSDTKVEPDLSLKKDKTIAYEKNGKHTLVFDGDENLIRRDISKEQYDSFISKHPSGNADGNVVDQYSDVPNKYYEQDGKFYEEIWNGNEYAFKLEITKGEYDYRIKNNGVLNVINN